MKFSLLPNVAFQIFDVLSRVSDECRLDITPDGWQVALVDPANVAAIWLDIPSSEFLLYDCNETVQVGIYLNNIHEELKEIIESKELNEIIKLSSKLESSPYKFILEHGIFTRDLQLTDTAGVRKSPKPLNIDLPHRIDIETTLLSRIIKKLMPVTDYVRFGVHPEDNNLQFTASSEDENDETSLIAKPTTTFSLKANPEVEVSSLLSLDYLNDIIPVIQSPITTLELGNDSPIIISFNIGKHGKARYIQAPRLESE